MKKYKCHKEVMAAKILELRGIRAKLDDGNLLFLGDDFIKKHNPQAGGYIVKYKDGYKSYSPAEAFEDGYTLAEDDYEVPALPAGLHLINGVNYDEDGAFIDMDDIPFQLHFGQTFVRKYNPEPGMHILFDTVGDPVCVKLPPVPEVPETPKGYVRKGFMRINSQLYMSNYKEFKEMFDAMDFDVTLLALPPKSDNVHVYGICPHFAAVPAGALATPEYDADYKRARDGGYTLKIYDLSETS